MTRPPSARTLALQDQILAYLDTEAPLPVSTPAVHAALSPPCDGWPHTRCRHTHLMYTHVYQALCRLARAGEVEKWPPSEDRKACLWRRLGGQAPALPAADGALARYEEAVARQRAVSEGLTVLLRIRMSQIHCHRCYGDLDAPDTETWAAPIGVAACTCEARCPRPFCTAPVWAGPEDP